MSDKEKEEKERKEREEKERKAREEKQQEREKSETVTVKLEDLKKVVKETVDETVTERLKAAGVGEVDRSKVAVKPEGDENDDRRMAGQAGRADPTFEALYRGLPEWERKLRTPETDRHVADWAVGVIRNDFARMTRAHNAINKIEGKRDLNTSDDSALVPSPLANLIVERRRKIQVIGPRSRIFTSESNTLGVPVDTGVAAAAGVAEAATITPSDPTHGTVTLTKQKSVVATRSSVEFIEDNAFNAVGFLSEQAAGTLARYNDAQDAFDGDGTPPNQTDALENNGSIETIDAAVAALVFTDVTALWYGLLSQYRSGAYWFGNPAMMQILGEVLDLNLRPIFAPGDAAALALDGAQGAPGVGLILGRPVLEIEGMTDGTIMIGNLDYYGVLESGGIRAEVSTHEAFLTDEVTFKWVQRRDGAVLQAEAFKKSLLAT